MPTLSESALQKIYINYRDQLEAMLFGRLRCRETAADICQEAFVRLYVSNLRVENIQNVRAYLYRIALNLLYDHYRRQALRQPLIAYVPEEDWLDQDDGQNAERVALSAEQLNRVFECLSGLTPLCQRIFFLNRFEGLKHREIAERLNVSIRTVEDNIRRALLHCAKAVD